MKVKVMKIITVQKKVRKPKKELCRISDKWRKRTKGDIVCERLMRRKVSKNVKDAISKFPDIGQQIEKFVEGADRWRRTGMYTFAGDLKKEKRMTFRRLRHTCFVIITIIILVTRW